jgi:hypothetical protein
MLLPSPNKAIAFILLIALAGTTNAYATGFVQN